MAGQLQISGAGRRPETVRTGLAFGPAPGRVLPDVGMNAGGGSAPGDMVGGAGTGSGACRKAVRAGASWGSATGATGS